MKVKEKKYILVLASLCIVIHTIAILYLLKLHFYISLVLLISQILLVCFGFLYYYSIKKDISFFFRDILQKMDCMINGETIATGNIIDDTLFSQTYHRLDRLYGILLSKQKELETEKINYNHLSLISRTK